MLLLTLGWLPPALGLPLLLAALFLPIPESSEADGRADALAKHTTAHLAATWRTAMNSPAAGDPITYVSRQGEPRHALILLPWTETCCNLVFVEPGCPEPQIETSVVHESQVPGASGHYWTEAP